MIEYLTPLYLAAVSRWHGSAIPTLKVLEGVMYAAPYTVLSGYYAAQNGASMVTIGAITVACLAATIAAKNTGHADGFKNYVRDNPISYIAKLFPVDRNSQAYDAIFFAIKGAAIAAFTTAVIAYTSKDYTLAASIFCASFCGYPLAYWIGYRFLHHKVESPAMIRSFLCSKKEIENRKYRIGATTWGELLSGFFAGLGFLFA
jgi:hypothetical protein